MGGGATIRAVSKVAGFAGGVVPGGLRGPAAAAAPPAEQAVRKSSIPASAMLSSSSSSSSRGGADVAAIQRPAWEFADDVVVAAGEPMRRVVFAGVPNFDEAKEAALDLKDVVDMYQLSGMSNGTLSVPNHGITALHLLATNTKVQDAVASIASDQNVFQAVMCNPVFQDFIQSNKNNCELRGPLVPEKPEDSSVKPEARDSGNWFTGVFEKIKLATEKIKLTLSAEKIKISTVDLVTFLSGKFHDIFGPSDIDEKAGLKDGTFEMGMSFLGLVTLVVMVVLLKRVQVASL